MTESAFKFSSTEPSTAPQDLCFLQNTTFFFLFAQLIYHRRETHTRADARTRTHKHTRCVLKYSLRSKRTKSRDSRAAAAGTRAAPDRSAFTSACGEAAVPQVAFLYEAAASFWKGRQKSHFARALSPLSANLQLAPVAGAPRIISDALTATASFPRAVTLALG